MKKKCYVSFYSPNLYNGNRFSYNSLSFIPHFLNQATSGRVGLGGFPQSSPQSAELCIGSWKGAGNTLVFWQPPGSPSQHPGCVSNIPPPWASGLGMAKGLEGTQADITVEPS